MSRITPIVTLHIAFTYEAEDRTYQVEAQVEKDAPGSYTCVNIVGAEEVSDHLWKCMADKAEELCWERENAPRNKRSGCNCPPYVDNVIRHEIDCPLKLQGEEREAYIDLLQKESRSTYRSSYHEEQDRQRHENTMLYLDLK